MQAKSKGAKKSFKAIAESTKKYSGECREALNLNYYVEARMRPEEVDYIKAKIIECRLKKGIDPKSSFRSKDSYEYYLHFCGVDRRMDKWIPYSQIKETTEYIDEAPKKKGDKTAADDDHDDEHEGMDHTERLAHEEATKLKTIFTVKFGKYSAETWYYSPFPEEYHDIDYIYYCEFCLEFFRTNNELERHIKKCALVHPPGNLIYKDEEQKITVWEVDAVKNMAYCENLAYLSKLFLDHKLLLYPIDPFLFFILCEYDEYGHHVVGYFSKNKYFTNNFNLSCILTLPFYQRKGYGKFLISLSYELSVIEQKIGTPERPLSDLGRQSYIAWWTQAIIDFIRDKVQKNESFSLDSMSKETSMRVEDIVDALENVKMIKKHKDQISICTDPEFLAGVYKQFGRPALKVKKENLHWVPYAIFKDQNKV